MFSSRVAVRQVAQRICAVGLSDDSDGRRCLRDTPGHHDSNSVARPGHGRVGGSAFLGRGDRIVWFDSVFLQALQTRS